MKFQKILKTIFFTTFEASISSIVSSTGSVFSAKDIIELLFVDDFSGDRWTTVTGRVLLLADWFWVEIRIGFVRTLKHILMKILK